METRAKMELFDEKKNIALEEFFASYARKHRLAYIVVLSVIMLFEGVMIVWGLRMFDFSLLRFQAYLAAYIFLLVVSVLGLIVIILNGKERISARFLTLALHLYCTFIIAWSLLVTYLDLIGGHTPIVFFTVIMSVGGLSVIYPVYYAVNLLISFAALLQLGRLDSISYFETSGYGIYLNLFIFVIVSMLLAARHYQISRRELEMSAYLEGLSFRDQLTGIANRRVYDERMRQADEKDRDVMVGMLDLDGFKGINDTNGHDFGDACLIATAQLLRDAFGDGTFRFGGDEFAVICPPAERAVLEEKISTINNCLAARFPEKNISISAGFCRRRSGTGQTMESAAKAADKALYTAKAGGKRQCRFTEEPV